MSDHIDSHIDSRAAYEYQAAMTRLVLLAQVVKAEPLDWLLATLDRAETLGPILDPSASRDADLGSQRTLVEAALAFRRSFNEIEARLVVDGLRQP
jgi:hypothetical protein